MKLYFYFSYDFVNIYDGDSIFASSIGSLTGILPGEVVSSGSDIFINFVSDGSEQSLGFRIQYEASKHFCLQCLSCYCVYQ